MDKHGTPIYFVDYPVWLKMYLPVCRNTNELKFRRDMATFRHFSKVIADLFNLPGPTQSSLPLLQQLEYRYNTLKLDVTGTKLDAYKNDVPGTSG